MRLTRCLFLALAGLLLSFHSVERAYGQSQKGIPSDGRDFYLAQMSSSLYCASITPFQSQWIVICSYYDCNVTIGYFDHTTGQEVIAGSYKVFAKNFIQIPIDEESAIVHNSSDGKNANIDGEVPEYTAIHVHADRPINVQYFSTGPDDCEMYLALPTSALGKRYVVAAAPNDDGTGGGVPRNCSGPPEPSSSFFGVLAVKDGTHVTLKPTGTTRKGIPGATSGPNSNGTPNAINITLQRGQVYWVKSDIKSNPGFGDIDMTGSQISSDQPVGVISGCENAFNGVTALGINDNRNLNLEMMVPYDYWASEGYLVMPMKDTPNLDEGNNSWGDQVKVVVGDTSAPGCQVSANIGQLGIRNNSIAPYQFPPVTYDNVGFGSIVSSTCGQKIFVEQYDYRAIESRSERMATAPTMMNVVPASRFRTSMMWSVPDDVLQVAKFRFINVIANPKVFSKIKLWKNGQPIGSMSSLPAAGSTTFPAPYDHLVGRSYAVGVGCYYATCDSAFAVYQYGMSAYDYPDKDLGDFDNDDYFHAYATPCGQSFGIDGAGRPSITVDTVCDGRPYWIIHVKDTAAVDHFISGIDILKDNLGVIKKRPDADSGYTSYNVEFEPVNYTVVPGISTSEDPKIVVQNPLRKAEAWVWAVNGAGNDTLVHLEYLPPAMEFGALYSQGVDKDGNASLEFKNAQTGVDTCSRFVFKNVSAAGSKAFDLKALTFSLGGQGFSAHAVDINGNPLTLPVTMPAGDSVIIEVCFNTQQAGRTIFDTLLAQTECPSAIGFLAGSTTLPEIVATDYAFGKVVIGDTVCHTIRVSNTGKANFTLTKKWLMQDYGNRDFLFGDTLGLPILIQPGKSVDLNFCFVPSDTSADSSVVTWGTDMSETQKTVKKNWSFLTGQGIKPSLTWDRDRQLVETECDTPRSFRAWLFNRGTTYVIIDTIRINPDNAADDEWTITDVQGGIFNNIILGQTHTPDSMWVDIKYTPNPAFLATNLPSPWTSDAVIVAKDKEGKFNPAIKLTASVAHADMTVTPTSVDLGIVGPGQMSATQTVTIKNTGTAPLIIEKLSIDNPFSFASGSPQQWDTIKAGQSKDFLIQGQTTDPVATGNLTIKGMTNCAPLAVIPITISTAAIRPVATGASFNTTYICQNGVQTVTTGPIGQGYKLVLDSVTITEDPSYKGESGEFVFDSTNSQSMQNIGLTMQNKETIQFKIRYSPTTTGAKHARIHYAYHRADDPSIINIVDTTITGLGSTEFTVVSAAKDPTNPTVNYTAKTDESIVVPIELTLPVHPEALVNKITFDITFVQDQFDPAGAAWLTGVNGFTVSSTETDAAGMATLHVTAMAPGAGTTLIGQVANLNLHVMVARTKSSQIVISNVAFYDATNPDPLCYVKNDVIPGTFVPTDICGDTTLRQYMITDKLRFTIDDARPNPATNNVTVKLNVTQNGTPVTIEMYNAVGEQVRTFATSQVMNAGKQSMNLDLSGLPQGSYTVRVTTPGETGTQMLLIQR